MTAWTCPQCRATNEGQACEVCGLVPGQAQAQPGASRCPVDGMPLSRTGMCEYGGGFPYGMKCPWACPECRGTLQWDGACLRCFGGIPWRFPGDRYELEDWHWRLVATGPREITKAQAKGCKEVVEQVLRGELTRQEAQEALRGILGGQIGGGDGPEPR